MKNDLDARVAYTLRKASKAIIATSITNVVALVGNIFYSNLMPLLAFAIFAIIVVTIDYILIICILPAYYTLYERHIEKLFTWRNIFKCCPKISLKGTIVQRNSDLSDSAGMQEGCERPSNVDPELAD